MKGEDLRPSHWAQSLRTRLIAFLTIALLPLGAIAVLQTVEVIQETERLAERDALSRTARAADEQADILERAFGSASALGAAAARLSDTPGACSAIMADFIATHHEFVFAGFIGIDGVMACNNAGTAIDYAGRAEWQAFVADPKPNVNISRNGEVSGQSVFIAFVPIFDPETDALLGGQALSIPHALSLTLFANEEHGLDLALVNPGGMILASSTGMDDLAGFERLGVVPGEMDVPARGLLLTRAGDIAPDERIAALVPLIREQIYVLGLWTPSEIAPGVTWFERSIPIFPLLMWLAGLGVAYITVNNLILMPLSRLSRQMRQYRSGGSEAPFVNLPGASSEFLEIADSYNALLDRVTADTAQLEANVAEKEVLLREVHHRVKNNLQLISSILNMQLRGVKDENARRILSRVQDRVMSLSSVHRTLYTENQPTSVRADTLLQDIVGSLSDMAFSASAPVAIRTELKPVHLDPDQAVPLALLATEAVTNAVKYSGGTNGSEPRIDISLQEDAEGQVLFRVHNTRGPTEAGPVADEADGTGLGARLIKSFASQLGGDLDIESTDAGYDLQVRFNKHPPA